MLVISRRRNEGIVIESPAGPVKVYVTGVDGATVRLGIEADKRWHISRLERIEWPVTTAEAPDGR